MVDLKKRIEQALLNFSSGTLADSARQLLGALGYYSDKTADFSSNPGEFVTELEEATMDKGAFPRDKVQLARWRECAFLFQLTNDEIPSLAAGQQALAIDTAVHRTLIESFVFMAIELEAREWGRTDLAAITRELNRRFPMPAIVLFKYGKLVSLAVIDRRPNKKDSNRDVIDSRITVIKDIHCAAPHRAHIDILSGLAIENLCKRRCPTNFRDLYDAWIAALSVQELNKKFYQELANWFFWGAQQVRYPKGAGVDESTRNTTSAIRLVTRLIFIWFIKERGLVPEELFDERHVRKLLKSLEPGEGSYYKAILQNLFFGTLNTEQSERRWAKRSAAGFSGEYLDPHSFRHEDLFSDTEQALKLFSTVPFLNGGLFECLDRLVTADELKRSPHLAELVTREGNQMVLRVDGFSRRPDNPLHVPNELFFGRERSDIDLNAIYGTKGKRYEVRGLITLLSSYKFTVDENTPLEEEVALDPELLGKVFENLLASYNPETATTARKQTGSFYTPREIVDYMVDESLHRYFSQILRQRALAADSIDEKLRELLGYASVTPVLTSAEIEALIDAIDHIKVLDPACGSGAFPMGVLLKLVHVLNRIDTGNAEWKARQIQRIEALKQQTEREITEPEIRARLLADYDSQILDIEEAFARNDLDYGRKLYLIENCLYGVDIQPIAVQIAKLRFFISLVVNEQLDESRPNRGIRALPNLETNFVAANTLVKAERPQQESLLGFDERIPAKEEELKRVRRRLFSARKLSDKKALRAQDERLREELAALLVEDHYSADIVKAIATWNPFDQNTSAGFFDPEWMFVEAKGFDIVIGNPPYLRLQGIQATQPEFVPYYRDHYSSATGNFDLYALFLERGLDFLDERGQLVYILPHKFFQAGFAVALRKLLTDHMALRQIVRFGAEQVFGEATTYTCLLFLTAQPQSQFDLLEVRSLEKGDEVLLSARQRREHPDYAYGTLCAPTGDEWDFTLGENNKVMQRLKQHPRALGDITRKIFVGLQTSADKIYVLKLLQVNGDILRCYSKQLDCEIEIERGLTRPFLMGKDVHRYEPVRPENVVIFPYWLRDSRAVLMTQAEIKRQFPLGWKYLAKNRQALGDREKGRMHGELFYAYIYPKNLAEFDAVKIMTPEIALGCQMTLDEQGVYYHTTKVYSLALKSQLKVNPKFLLGLLNSKVLWYFLTQTGYVLRGGYYTFKTDYLKPFPIPEDSSDHQRLIETLVDYVLALKREAASLTDTPPRLAVMTSWFEQLIDALVYELYFPEEFSSPESRVSIALGGITLPKSENLGNRPSQTLSNLFDALHDPNHPVRRASFFVDSIAPVRVIEGKA